MNSRELLQKSILESMSEAIMLIGFDGVISFANPAANEMLGFSKDGLAGEKFAALFFDDPANDGFSQAVLDAVYERNVKHQSLVVYHRKDRAINLRVTSSYLHEGKERIGIIIVMSDLTELTDTRDALRRFLSDDIVKQLFDTPEGMKVGGKKQVLTVMMSDLRGFTAMSERLDPADLVLMLNHYLGEMTEVIQENRGTIIEFIGDGIMAIFGAPEPTQTHATDAVVAALCMQARMEEINRWNKEHDLPVLEMGIGLNTGEVIVGNLGSEKRTKYGVVGSNVNLCGRIESYTVGGQILIPPSTSSMIDAKLEIAKKMTVYPKGAKGELELAQVTGIGEPYDIHVQMSDSILQQLDISIPVSFFKLEGKHEIARRYYGGITAVSRDGACLESDTKLEVYDNIQIDAGGKLFCKVTDVKDGGYILQYTSVPTGYAAWLKEARKA